MPAEFWLLPLLCASSIPLPSAEGSIWANFQCLPLFSPQRVIDGDTLVTEGTKIRLLWIDAPDRGEPGYEEAKKALLLETQKGFFAYCPGKDPFGRKLCIFWNFKECINRKLVLLGLADLYTGSKELVSEFRDAYEKERGIWRRSKYFGCLEIGVLADPPGPDCPGEKVILRNRCEKINVSGWKVCEGAGRCKVLEGAINAGETVEIVVRCPEKHPTDWCPGVCRGILNNDGDVIYVWDSEGKLVARYAYGKAI